MSFIAFATDAFDEMARFYGETLGFPVMAKWDRPDGRGQRFALGGGLQLEILDNARERNPRQLDRSERVHVVVEVDDIQAARKGLQVAAPEPRVTSWGASLFQVHDPDGTAVTFLEWEKKSTNVATMNPVTGVPIQTYAFQSADELNASLANAAEGFATWRDTALGERAGIILRLAGVLRARREELARLMTLEMGKAITQSRAEVEKCAVLCEWVHRHGPALLADEPTTVENDKAYVSYLPLGTVLAIMPWNFPFWQALRAAVPIMMGGNSIVLSHSKNVTGCAYALADAFQAAGFPAGVFEVINIPTDGLAGVIADRRIAAVTLTGSVRAGKAVASEAGKVLKKCVLELGGSDPFIVLADADLEAALDAAVKARYSNTGQICICAKRFILEAPIAEEFTRKFVEATGKLVSGDPLDDNTFLGPMARADLRDEIHRQVSESVSMGAKLLLGGEMPDTKGAYYPPTILADVRPGMAAWDEETFGPLAALAVARDADEALALANRSDFGLSGNLWTGDVARGEAMARRMETGAVYINGFSASDPRVPIGGVKNSGYGRELSHFGIREFVNAQVIWKDRR